MPIKLTQLPGEAIISASVIEPFEPQHDVSAMFTEFIQLRLALQHQVALIVDLGSTMNLPDAFSQMVIALANAAKGIQASKASPLTQPPITFFIGSGDLAGLAATAVGQEQYGGVPAQLCASYEEALTLARRRLSA